MEENSEDLPPIEATDKYRLPDDFLQFLVSTVNSSGVGESGPGTTVGITLHVGGLIISGHLISLKTFFGELGGVVRSADSDASDESLETFAKLFEQYGDNVMANASEEAMSTPKYIHLRDVVAYPSIPSLPGTYHNDGQVWRGQLSAVDGFCLGTTQYSAG